MSRKFILSAMALVSTVIALFTGNLDASGYNISMATILGIYTGGNVVQKKGENNVGQN